MSGAHMTGAKTKLLHAKNRPITRTAPTRTGETERWGKASAEELQNVNWTFSKNTLLKDARTQARTGTFIECLS